MKMESIKCSVQASKGKSEGARTKNKCNNCKVVTSMYFNHFYMNDLNKPVKRPKLSR